ncbi:MAG: insulinase family protein [Deltaproteobacteria bacterium]|nr:insulinase family protein [Deltaproteobacteria bacterium]
MRMHSASFSIVLLATLSMLGVGCPPSAVQRTDSKPGTGASVASPSDPSQEKAVVVEHFGTVRRSRLSNGLTVVVDEQRAAPVVAIQVWVDVGSADEGPEELGLAHLHEHMLFKGTLRRGVGEIAGEIEAAGGDINAWTSYDQTVYHVVLASRFWKLGLDVLADAVQHAVFDPKELEREKQVVGEEIKRSRDMPGRYLGEMMFETVYRKHGYGRPILGTDASLAKVDQARIKAFFKRHYRPENMTLVVVGDVDSGQVLQSAQRLFRSGKARKKVAVNRVAEPTQRKLRVKLGRDKIQEAHLGLSWHIPGVRHADVPALDVLATLLGQGDSARLTLELKRGRGLVNDVYAYAYTPEDPGIFVIGASCASDKVLEVVKALGQEAGRLSSVPVSSLDLTKVKTMIESDVLYLRETVEGQARRLGYHQTMMDDPAYGDSYLARVNAVSAADLMRVAATYLEIEKLSLVVLAPEAGKEKAFAEADLRKAVEGGFKAVPKLQADSQEQAGAVTRIKLRGGPTLLIQEDHTNALVSMRAVFLGGSRYESEASNGLFNFLASMLTQGSVQRDAATIARESDSIAGSIGGFSGRNTVGIRAEFPSRHLAQGLGLFADCLLNPVFPDKEVKRERELILEEIASRDDNLAGLAFEQFTATLYAKHPYRLTVLGTRQSVAGISRKALAAAHGKHMRPEQMILAVVGDVDRERLVEQIKALFTGRKKKTSIESGPPAVMPLEPKQTEVRLAVKHRSRQQAHLVLGYQGTRLRSQDRYPLEVLMAVLAGQGGRLFVELRDKRSLAYAVTGFSLEGIEPGFVAVYLGVDPTRAGEAVPAVLAELERVRTKPVGAKELAGAKRYLVGTHAISLQKTAARAATVAFNELYGLGSQEHTRYAEHIMAVTPADVLGVARKYFVPGAYTLSVVGPQDKFSNFKAVTP